LHLAHTCPGRDLPRIAKQFEIMPGSAGVHTDWFNFLGGNVTELLGKKLKRCRLQDLQPASFFY